MILLILVVVTALGFDFTNGFHDTANAMATSIATGALKPKVAVALSAVLNLVGAFLSVAVALTVTNAVVKIQDSSGAPQARFLDNHGYALLMIILAGLVGGIVWNLLTWLLGLPSSSSHALFGGLIGSTIAGLGLSGVNWVGDGTKLDGVVWKVILPAVVSPLLAVAVAGIGTWLVYKVTAAVSESFKEKGFRWGQIVSASLVSLAHGTNDAQKTMGVITLSLIATGHWTDTSAIPLLGQDLLRHGDRPRHVPWWLADHPDPRKGPGRDQLTTGSRGGELLGSGDPGLHAPGFRAVDDARGHGFHPRDGTGSAGRCGAVGCSRPDAGGVVHHASLGCGRRGRDVVDRTPRRRHRRRDRDRGHLGCLVGLDVLPFAGDRRRLQQRQRRLGGNASAFPKPGDGLKGDTTMLDLFVQAVWKVMLAGLILGAGLPALFALGVRFNAVGAGEIAAGGSAPRSGYRALGLLCFLVVAVLVALGITVIVAAGLGKTVSFDHVFPTLVPKS